MAHRLGGILPIRLPSVAENRQCVKWPCPKASLTCHQTTFFFALATASGWHVLCEAEVLGKKGTASVERRPNVWVKASWYVRLLQHGKGSMHGSSPALGFIVGRVSRGRVAVLPS